MIEQLKYDIVEQKKNKIRINNRRYLGNKYKLLDFINKVVEENCDGINTVADIFGGTGVVAYNFYSKGKKIIVNDILFSNYAIYNAWFGKEDINILKIENIIEQFNNTEVKEDNYVSKNFGGTYFTIPNSRKIGYIREEIENMFKNKYINFREKSILITSLIYALDKVANTCGHYDAYRKKMDSCNEIELLLPDIDENINMDNKIYKMDANELVKDIYADLVYIDTPYNSRQYGDSYHLLENISKWEKPEVTGIAKKMKDRSDIKSKYCLKSAPKVFENLIENIKAKYIIVSYNNMAQKGDGRSNAKISNEEIIETLKSKGNVKIFETEYKAFTTGNRILEDHKEILYLCEVDPKKELNNKKHVKSCLNYTGGKYKLLDQITPLFPSKIDTFVDVFCGGASVGINVNAKRIICNDNEESIISLFNVLKQNDFNKIVKEIESLIKKYELSNTYQNGYEFYGETSLKGLSSYNKEKYLRLRKDYNDLKPIDNNEIFRKSIMFYLLTVYAFNNQIRFNKKGGYNIPVGKRDFNYNIRANLKSFIEIIKEKDIHFTNKDFREFDWSSLNRNDFVYLDPPYLISTATYNEQGGWTEKNEIELLDRLDKLNERGIKFALSNVIEHKGNKNELLESWAKRYNINYLDYNYKNSNYQKKDKKSNSIEVLITNY